MNRDLVIDKGACGCNSNEDNCPLTVIRRSDNRQFEIQRQRWDLSAVSSSGGGKRLSQASGAGLRSGNVGVDNFTCMELRLTFSNPERRQDYEKRFHIIQSVYQQDDKAYENSKIADRIRADRPVRQSAQMYSLASPSSPRTNGNSSLASLNFLPRIANVSAIQLELPYMDERPAAVPAPRQPGSSNNNTNRRYIADDGEDI